MPHPLTMSGELSTSQLQDTPSLDGGDIPRAAARRRYHQYTGQGKPRFCYVCGYLLTAVEAVIGTHVRCVYEMDRRQARTRIPSPTYGCKR